MHVLDTEICIQSYATLNMINHQPPQTLLSHTSIIHTASHLKRLSLVSAAASTLLFCTYISLLSSICYKVLYIYKSLFFSLSHALNFHYLPTTTKIKTSTSIIY